MIRNIAQYISIWLKIIYFNFKKNSIGYDEVT